MSKINVTTEELNEYMNIEFDEKEYRVHYDTMLQQSKLPCFKCKTTKDTTEIVLTEIGAIYDAVGYFQIDNTFEKYDELLKEVICQIKKKKCFVSCIEHSPDFDEIEEKMGNENGRLN